MELFFRYIDELLLTLIVLLIFFIKKNGYKHKSSEIPNNFEKEKNINKRVFRIVVIVFLISLIVIYIWGMLSSFLFIDQKPPQITDGEFPFVLEYEMEGKTYIIEDAVYCSFVECGFVDVLCPNLRIWDERLSENKYAECVIASFGEQNSVLEPEQINSSSELVFVCGSAEYYMGDKINEMSSRRNDKPHFVLRETYTGDDGTKYIDAPTVLTEEYIKQYFGIVIKKLELSKPIKNEFK